MKRLEEFSDELSKCVRCGSCKSGCPTFSAVGKERASARGRLSVVRSHLDGTIKLTEAYEGFIKDCTLCASCAAVCPNGVDTPAVVLAARAELTREKGLPPAANFLFKKVLDSSYLGHVAMRLASRFQALVLKAPDGSSMALDPVTGSGLISRFQLPYMPDMSEGRLVPPLAKRFFLDQKDVKALSGKNKEKATGQPSVAFFAGCGVNYIMPKVGSATLEVLERAGVSVTVPKAQLCCGMPALSMGDIETAKSLALKNLEVFEATDADFITTSCATCTYSLKTNFMKLLGDTSEMRERVEKLSAKVRDITELLVEELNIEPRREKSSGKVTYHDPCHLSRGQGLRDAPRELIERSGVDFVEMKNPCKCCGLGGGLGFSNYELSKEIVREKVRSIRETGAEVVATACPGCIVQLRDGLFQSEQNVSIKHVVELFIDD